jgi:hypothetical protein|tara:strand:- start:49 stop:309 length:261 start_codon:yes stop_codon:yes gene_type:complete
MAVKQAVKFTEDELKSLKSLQNQSQVATLQFGQLYLSKLRLEEQETTLKNQLKQLEQEEAKAAQTLTEKYGKGTIDIESGEFTPTE